MRSEMGLAAKRSPAGSPNAKFKMDSAVEDIDYRHPRRLDRQLIRTLSKSEWAARIKEIPRNQD